MLTTIRSTVPAVLLAILALTACSDDSSPVTGSAGSSSSSTTPDVPAAEVDRSQLPDWIPADLPMPAGQFLSGSRYECSALVTCDFGHSLMFMVDDMDRADALVDALTAYGHEQTSFEDDFDGRDRKVWFTEGPKVRANVVVERFDYGVQLDYNVDPVED